MPRKKKTLRPITNWLLSGIFCALFPCKAISVSAEQTWERMGEYVTYFNVEDKGRCENIEIAGALINGITLQAFGEFSFNQTVGRRTEEFGFKQAKIIVNGQYALGVGGGVCQVSTTLYNTALLSGLSVTEYHPHSLKVGYVAPSRDAMVSSHSDLKLYNPYPFAVRLCAETENGCVRIRFLGRRLAKTYKIVSVVVGEIPPPAPIVKEGKEDGVLREGKSGVKSEAYLETYQNGKLVVRKRLREDVYRPTQGVVVKKTENPHNFP